MKLVRLLSRPGAAGGPLRACVAAGAPVHRPRVVVLALGNGRHALQLDAGLLAQLLADGVVHQEIDDDGVARSRRVRKRDAAHHEVRVLGRPVVRAPVRVGQDAGEAVASDPGGHRARADRRGSTDPPSRSSEIRTLRRLSRDRARSAAAAVHRHNAPSRLRDIPWPRSPDAAPGCRTRRGRPRAESRAPRSAPGSAPARSARAAGSAPGTS